MLIAKTGNKALNYLVDNLTFRIVISIIAIFLLAFPSSLIAKNQSDRSPLRIIISYDRSVNKSLYTHSNETIASVIADKSISNATKNGLLQPYLEQFSRLCNDGLENDNNSYTNIVDFYPLFSAQPAWVALFRGGQYQIFYSKSTIRIFVKGKTPEGGYNQHYSVIRHPINKVLKMDNLNISRLEVYTFNNDYFKYQIALNLTPYILETSKLVKNSENNYCLLPRNSSLDLEGLENIFKYPMTPEAIQVTKDNKFYLYARMNLEHDDISVKPITLSDFAVIYRAIFHYGYNPPFISLDKDENSRYAKVNFGGYLENTEMGEIVLEADKLFKTITTGLDLNNKQFIVEELRQKVDSFVTEEERSFLDSSPSQKISNRYWFYPDSILTVTDGDIGLVKKCQFFADVKRMDEAINQSAHSKQTVDHLNTHFAQYQTVFPTLRELDNVGRLMGLVKWLKYSNVDERMELDELLSVELPACYTPLEHERILVLNNVSYSQNEGLTMSYIRDNIKQFYLTDLIPDSLKIDSDQDFFDFAANYHSKLGKEDTIPRKHYTLYAQNQGVLFIMESQKKQIEEIKSEIETMKKQKNYNQSKHNQLVKKQNEIVRAYNSNIKRVDKLVAKIKDLHISNTSFVSLSGGVDLNPNKLTVLYSENDSEIGMLRKMKFRHQRNVSIYEGWLRSSFED